MKTILRSTTPPPDIALIYVISDIRLLNTSPKPSGSFYNEQAYLTCFTNKQCKVSQDVIIKNRNHKLTNDIPT